MPAVDKEKEKDKEKDVEHKREQESPVLKKANISLRSVLVFFGFDLFIDKDPAEPSVDGTRIHCWLTGYPSNIPLSQTPSKLRATTHVEHIKGRLIYYATRTAPTSTTPANQVRANGSASGKPVNPVNGTTHDYTVNERNNGISIAIDTANCAFTIAVNTTIDVGPAVSRTIIAQLHAPVRDEPNDVLGGLSITNTGWVFGLRTTIAIVVRSCCA